MCMFCINTLLYWSVYQWWIFIWRSGILEEYTLWHCTVLWEDLTCTEGFATGLYIYIYQYVSRYLISFCFGLHQQLKFEVIISTLLNKVWNEWKLLKLWPIFPCHSWGDSVQKCMHELLAYINAYVIDKSVCSKIRPDKILWHLLHATRHKISYWNFTGVYTVGVNIKKNWQCYNGLWRQAWQFYVVVINVWLIEAIYSLTITCLWDSNQCFRWNLPLWGVFPWTDNAKEEGSFI